MRRQVCSSVASLIEQILFCMSREKVLPGYIIVRQRGRKFHPGINH